MNYKKLRAGSCEASRSPVCAVPSAATCADLCPFGFFSLGDSCFKIDPNVKYDSPFKARQKCYSDGGTYNLASIRSVSILNQLIAKMIEMRFGETQFWIGLDDSIRKSHATTSFFATPVTADPDGLWLMDSGDSFPPTGSSVTWGPGHPVAGDEWAWIFFNGTSGSIQSVDSPSGVVESYFICERPKPCFVCDRGWKFFNGNCYLLISTSLTVNEARGACDAHNAYLFSVNTPIEQKFLETFLPSNVEYFFGLTKVRAGNGLTENDYEWDDGTTLATRQYSYWNNGQPNANGGGVDGWAQFVNRIEKDQSWQDIYNDYTYPFICEKKAHIPTIQCPKRKYPL